MAPHTHTPYLCIYDIFSTRLSTITADVKTFARFRLVSFHLSSMPSSNPIFNITSFIYQSMIHSGFFQAVPISSQVLLSSSIQCKRKIYIRKLFCFVDTCVYGDSHRLSHVVSYSVTFDVRSFSLLMSISFYFDCIFFLRDWVIRWLVRVDKGFVTVTEESIFEYHRQCENDSNVSIRQKVCWKIGKEECEVFVFLIAKLIDNIFVTNYIEWKRGLLRFGCVMGHSQLIDIYLWAR